MKIFRNWHNTNLVAICCIVAMLLFSSVVQFYMSWKGIQKEREYHAKLEATILGDGDGKEGGLVVVAPEGLFKGVNVHGASTVWSATTMAKIAEVESALDGKESSADYKYIVIQIESLKKFMMHILVKLFILLMFLVLN